jgi:hypothetical protein
VGWGGGGEFCGRPGKQSPMGSEVNTLMQKFHFLRSTIFKMLLTNNRQFNK